MWSYIEKLFARGPFASLNRNGIIAVMLCVVALPILIWGFVERDKRVQMDSRVAFQEDRLLKLKEITTRYARLAPNAGSATGSRVEEPISLASTLINKLGLRDRIVSISTVGSGVSLQLNGLYGKDVALVLQEFRTNGLNVVSSELRSVPDGAEKKYMMSMLIGGN